MFCTALKKAAENRKAIDSETGQRKKVALSVIEAFGGASGDSSTAKVPVRDVEDVLRLEYRSKLLNPKWRDAMIAQGSGGAYEVSQRMTAMVGWAATTKVDNFVFNEAAERYVLDEEVAQKLQKSNPEAFKNVDQTKRIKNTLFRYKRIDKQVEENQRLRELINSCCASLDTYNKQAGKEVVVLEIPVVDKVEDILNVKS